MTPRRARQALCVFLVLAVAVAYNALFRQLRPAVGGGISAEAPALAAPAPMRAAPSKAAPSPPAERIQSRKDAPEKRGAVRVKPEWATTGATGTSVVVQKSEAASPETVRAIQRELRQRGYGNLPSDGTLRLQTRAAIMAYEYDQGLPLSAQASEGLLSRILFGGSSPSQGQGQVGTPEAAELVRFVQQSLAALGYQPGSVNGQFEADTMRAIREFEMDKGLVPKGRISAELIGQLTAPTAPKLSRR
jgi:peptidoglycan hydrolase-like protein with peptidoglycan-binding domain